MELRCKFCEQDKEQSEFRTTNQCFSCYRSRSMEAYRKNRRGTLEHRQYAKLKSIERRLGVTKEQYEQMSDAQLTCAICDKFFDNTFDKQLDHCHKTGKIRKFLCHKCNKALGLLNDNPTLLEKAANYLKENK